MAKCHPEPPINRFFLETCCFKDPEEVWADDLPVTPTDD